VVDCGHGVTHCVPIYEGYAIPHAILAMPLSGKDLTEYMYQMLLKPGVIEKFDEDAIFDLESARIIKENHCIVA
jgi:actin-related protein